MADELVERLPKEAAMLQEIAQSQARGGAERLTYGGPVAAN